MDTQTILYIIIIILLILITAFNLFYHFWFMRNPKIKINQDKNTIISPADGKVLRIIEFNKENVDINKGYLGKILATTADVAKEGYIVCIMMNPFNVHYQIAPVSGVVSDTRHINGRLRNVMMNPSNLRFIENERHETIIKAKFNSNGKKKTFNVKVIQIAGIFARRACSFVKKNQKLNKGEHLGIIKLGSMVVLITPKITLKCGERQRIHLGDIIGLIK